MFDEAQIESATIKFAMGTLRAMGRVGIILAGVSLAEGIHEAGAQASIDQGAFAWSAIFLATFAGCGKISEFFQTQLDYSNQD